MVATPGSSGCGRLFRTSPNRNDSVVNVCVRPAVAGVTAAAMTQSLVEHFRGWRHGGWSGNFASEIPATAGHGRPQRARNHRAGVFDHVRAAGSAC